MNLQNLDENLTVDVNNFLPKTWMNIGVLSTTKIVISPIWLAFFEN